MWVYINGGSHTRKILFSSDLGNIATQDTRVFVEDFKPIFSANIAIMECTYCSKDRQCTKETYKKDIEKIKSMRKLKFERLKCYEEWTDWCRFFSGLEN